MGDIVTYVDRLINELTIGYTVEQHQSTICTGCTGYIHSWCLEKGSPEISCQLPNIGMSQWPNSFSSTIVMPLRAIVVQMRISTMCL